ncbi:MAG TPA: hypothetical protein DHV96_13550 [Lachnospiraceae bacterium]|nr:hypothetical protein [Lachnospiraceae bacterium]
MWRKSFNHWINNLEKRYAEIVNWYICRNNMCGRPWIIEDNIYNLRLFIYILLCHIYKNIFVIFENVYYDRTSLETKEHIVIYNGED